MRRDVQRWWRNIRGNVGWSGASPNIHLELIRSCHRTVAQVIPDATLSGHPFLLERVKTTLNFTYGLIIGSCIVCSSPSELLKRISAAEILINEIEQTLSRILYRSRTSRIFAAILGPLWLPLSSSNLRILLFKSQSNGCPNSESM